jgi:hypothetical protein
MPNPREEYIASLMENNEHIQKLLKGAAMVQQGGVEGLQETAKSDPEIILAAIAGLVAVVNLQQTEHLEFVEQHFQLLDSIGIK